MQVSVVPRPGWLTWGRLVAIALAVMLVGVVAGLLIIDRLGLFALPLPYTVPFYLLFWLPVFVVGLLLLLIVLGAAIEVIGLVILLPTLNYTNVTCQAVPQPQTHGRYERGLPTYQNSLFTYVLEGREGALFVQPLLPTRSATGG
jgi:hypothetical protein